MVFAVCLVTHAGHAGGALCIGHGENWWSLQPRGALRHSGKPLMFSTGWMISMQAQVLILGGSVHEQQRRPQKRRRATAAPFFDHYADGRGSTVHTIGTCSLTSQDLAIKLQTNIWPL